MPTDARQLLDIPTAFDGVSRSLIEDLVALQDQSQGLIGWAERSRLEVQESSSRIRDLLERNRKVVNWAETAYAYAQGMGRSFAG